MTQLLKSSRADSRVGRVLHEAVVDGRVRHPNGEYRDVVANISRRNSRALRDFVRERKPELVIEIGMGHGVSTLSILSAVESNGIGRLISIDPYIGWPTGRLIALHQVERAGVAVLHEHLHECSYSALPTLLDAGVTPDLVYIDGNHNFDYVFTDFFYADKLLAPGGVVAFNDAGWGSVHKVIRFLRKYRRYRELDVGLPRSFAARNPLYSLIKRLEGRSSFDRYFHKTEAWEPEYGFHRAF